MSSAAVAEQLRRAYAEGPIAPVRGSLASPTAELAYEIQDINTRHWSAAGRRIVGRKIGLTSHAVQQQLGVDQPDFGMLFADMEVPNGGEVAVARLLQPRVEAEVAFVLGARPRPRRPDDERGAARDRLRAPGDRDRRQPHRRIGTSASSTRSPTTPPRRCSCSAPSHGRLRDVDLRLVPAWS